MKKKILISTGGSGGHVIPAISFYEHLKENFDVSLVVDQRGHKFINKNKFKYTIINSPRLSLNPLKLPLTLINLIISLFKSFFFLKKNKIDILLATGGYMSVPICLAAKIMKIKIYLFEPNAVIGRANKFLIKFCNKIFCYSEKIVNFPKKHINKIIVINHILRKEIYAINNFTKEKIDNCINLLILGGSQGAQFFDNNIKNSIIKKYKKFKIKVFHQISSADLLNFELFYKEHNIVNKLFNFEENIFKYISEANLVISRAGASTLSELAFLKVPFITIPFKHAKDDHQLENAIYYEKKDCCWLIKEEEFNQNKLTTLLISIIQNKEEYLRKKKAFEKFSYQNSWDKINEKILEYINEN